MNYLSLSFAAFVILAVLLYYILPKKCRTGVLLVSSLMFYGLFDNRYFVFLLFTAITTFLSALFIEKIKRKRLLIFLCVLLNVGAWFYVKELQWTMGVTVRILHMFGSEAVAPTLDLIVPVGISYFTLQAISYLVDVSKGRIQAERNPFKYLLFLSWFPAIVQGPISRYDRLMPQLRNKEKASFEKIRSSLVLVLFGLVKKMVIADRIAVLVNHCFSNYAELHGMVLYLGAVGFAIQLYADFSGCVDICRGVSGLFGVDLINNFNRPYFSRSIKEFWSRWHISLSSWLKDYVYIPLGGNRKGNVRRYINIIITFLVSGLWHGAGFNFFVWGILHAIYQIIGSVTLPIRKKIKGLLEIKEGSFAERFYQIFITFNLTAFAWIFFRAEGLKVGVAYVKNMLDSFSLWAVFDESVIFGCGLSQNAMLVLFFNVVVMFAVEHMKKSQEESVSSLLDTHFILRWGIYVLLIFDVLFFGVYGTEFDMAGFLYGGF